MINGGNASIYVTDMEQAIRFYSSTLGFKLRSRIANEWAELDAGAGLILGLHPAQPPASQPAGARGAINIELAVTLPMEQVVDALKQKGVVFEGLIQNFENVRLATLLDPDGNAIFLSQVLHSGTAQQQS